MSKLQSLIVCPVCKHKLIGGLSASLKCSSCKTKYGVIHDIPVLVDLGHLPEQLRGQIRYFGAEAKQYAHEHSVDPWQDKYVARLESFLGSYKGKTMIDNACGTGYMAIEAAKRGAYVVACDLNVTGLVRLRKIIESLGLSNRILLVCCTSEALPIRGDCADAIVANAILEHLPREEDAIAEITRIAKKHAISMITVPIKYRLTNPIFLPLNYFYDKKIGHLRRYTKEMLLSKFKEWKLLRLDYSGHTRKVIKTLVNLVLPIFNEDEIEQEDELVSSRKLFASNISVLLRKI